MRTADVQSVSGWGAGVRGEGLNVRSRVVERGGRHRFSMLICPTRDGRGRAAQRAARSAQRGVDINCLCAGVGRTLDAEDRCLDSHAPDSQSPPPPPPSNIIDWTVVAAAAAYCFVCVCPYVSETPSASLYHRESLSLSLSLSVCVCVCV